MLAATAHPDGALGHPVTVHAEYGRLIRTAAIPCVDPVLLTARLNSVPAESSRYCTDGVSEAFAASPAADAMLGNTFSNPSDNSAAAATREERLELTRDRGR